MAVADVVAYGCRLLLKTRIYLCGYAVLKKDNPMRWFTSDTHFFHQRVIEYDNRPYKDVVEMQDCLIRNWNMCVSKKDIVYHLGDFAFGNPKRWKPIVDQLQGNIVLIRGNHDINNGATLSRLIVDGVPMFRDVRDVDFTTIGGRRVMLSHFPYKRNDGDIRMAEYRPNDTGLWLICGHTHNLRPRIEGRIINVGCMNWNYFPLSENQINIFMRQAEEKL